MTLDQFQFRVVVKDNPLTRRGVLSTVASVYDPLGFAAPFILIGKQILQQMCRDKLNWDDALPEDLRPLWESWLLELKHLAAVKIARCYVPSGFKVQHYELHHFLGCQHSGLWRVHVSQSSQYNRKNPLLLSHGEVKSCTYQGHYHTKIGAVCSCRGCSH